MQLATTRHVLVGLALCATAGGVMFGLARLRGQPLVAQPKPESVRPEEPELVPSRSGPWPRAVADVDKIEFGTVLEGNEAESKIRISNEGQAPLVVKAGNISCECQLLGVPDQPIPPGNSVELTAIWKPRVGAEQFSMGIAIRTNDPEHREMFFRLSGMARPWLMTFPKEDWNIDVVREDRPTELLGTVMSPTNQSFRIERVEVGDAPIDVEFRKMTERGRSLMANLKEGWEVSLWIRPEMPIGKFRYPITIVTDLPRLQRDGSSDPATKVAVQVTGRRKGPFRFLGKGWYDDRSTMSLGSFAAATGRSLKVLLFCEDPGVSDLQILKIDCDVKPTEFTAVRDDRFKGRGSKFDFEVRYPAGGPVLSRQLENSAKVRVQTNHPGCPEFVFQLDFNAT